MFKYLKNVKIKTSEGISRVKCKVKAVTGDFYGHHGNHCVCHSLANTLILTETG